ncbi:PucR family transcriptional regulator [Nonomuraea sp. FMUSA5-5]|uniref:PucR family transcriptional regulator n=1 Tax=Nonomuraea composti TaxID=2720023 RepID=A0ABX1AX04_9ACTN|nr:helix-turn-helix domain-containing protein [Nonomuraea sp. FMUSA5-5]NJP88559.1 PucR family transcriptional regulator [Nonomuraea sp. FMUSA5-5]
MSGVRGPGWEAPVTVAELVNAGPLAGARMYGAGENPVRGVRIVDEPSVFATVTPHTAVVLIGTAASGGWAVEMAMRRAWEQAAACVIAPAGGLSEGSGEVLAERLGVTLIFVDEDPLVVAVRVASAASRPDAARTQLVARCATRLAGAGASARRVLGVLNAELPGTSVAFLDRYGATLAGRRDARTDQPARRDTPRAAMGDTSRDKPYEASRDTPLEASRAVSREAPHEGTGEAASAGRSRWSAEVEVPDEEGGVLGTLVAAGSSRSPGWPAVVRTVLELAVAPLTAWAARERLRASRDFALQASLAERLLTEPEPDPDPDPDPAPRPRGGVEDTGSARAAAIALGWPIRGPLTAYRIRPLAEPGQAAPVGPGDGPLAYTLITAALGQVPVLTRGDGWAGWSALGPSDLAERLGETLRSMPWPCAGGAGAQVEGLGGLAESLLGAEAAAYVAGGAGVVRRADRMGPAELLGALPTAALRAPAAVVLRPLLAIDRDGTLLETLGAVLDEGGALRAAERLGVHRNTITTRLDRIKSAGFDLDDAPTRLALQLACHVMLR